MNPMIKAKIKMLIKNNPIELKRHPGTDEYKIMGPDGKPLLEITNGWDYGIYVIQVAGKPVARAEVLIDSPKPRTQLENDVLEIINDVVEENGKQIQEKNAAKNMTKEEKDIDAILAAALKNTKQH